MGTKVSIRGNSRRVDQIFKLMERRKLRRRRFAAVLELLTGEAVMW